MTNEKWLKTLPPEKIATLILYFPCAEICDCKQDIYSMECAHRCVSGECERQIVEWLNEEHAEGFGDGWID